MARSIGADHVIDYTQEDFSRNGRRYDLILAVNGNHALRDYTRALSPGETAVVLGGSIPQFLQGVVLATWDILSSTRSAWECMRCMRCREEDSLVGRDVIRACCQWQPQLSKKRDFFPSMVPHEHVPYSLRNRDQGERNKTCPRLLSGPGHDRGTDRNRRASDYLQAYSVTGRQIRLAMLFLKGTSLLYSWIVVGIFTLQSLDSSNVEEANISTDKDGFWRLIG
jgi:Zinc-binding dehydrogenase